MTFVKNRFQEKVIHNPCVNPIDIDQWFYWKKVVLFKGGEDEYSVADILALEIDDFQDKVIAIIDKIIDLWIVDYKTIHSDDRNFAKETLSIWEEMFHFAEGVEDAFHYIYDDEECDLEFSPEYILGAIEDRLMHYRKKVFSTLNWSRDNHSYTDK